MFIKSRRLVLSVCVGVLVAVGYFFRFGLVDRLRPPPTQFDEQFAGRLERRLAAGYYGELHSYLIWHGDEIVFEWYGEGYTADTLHPVYSVTKSVTSAALGMTVSEAEPIDLSVTLPELFPDYYGAVLGEEGDGAEITLEDLLTMRGGFAWDEVAIPFSDPENGLTRLARSQDWVATVLESEVIHPAGTQFNYNSGGTVLVGEVVAGRTGRPLDEFVAERLFAPLGITEWHWDQGAQGVTNAGWGLSLRPRDMVLLGRLFLQHGVWEGEQIVPAAWVAQSTKPHVLNTTWGLVYGYHWWRFADGDGIVQRLEENDLFFANGLGGQTIVVGPHLDLVVVATAAVGNDGGRMYPALRDYVFPAVSQNKP